MCVRYFSRFTGFSSFSKAATPWLLLGLVVVLCAPATAFAQVQYVQPVDWSRYSGKTGVQSGDVFGQKLVTLMQNQSNYLFGWIDGQCSQTSSDGQLMYVPKWSAGDEGAIRSRTQFARTNVQMIQTGVYSAVASGITQAEALQRTEGARP